MTLTSRKKVTLYEEAKAGLSSLVRQTTTVFIGFVFVLLITGGAPSSFVVALSFFIGTAFVSWNEQKRIFDLRSAEDKTSSDSKAARTLLITNQLITLDSKVYRTCEITRVSKYQIEQGFAQAKQYGLVVETTAGSKDLVVVTDEASVDNLINKIVEVMSNPSKRLSYTFKLSNTRIANVKAFSKREFSASSIYAEVVTQTNSTEETQESVAEESKFQEGSQKLPPGYFYQVGPFSVGVNKGFVHTTEQTQSLAETVSELQRLLEKISEAHPNDTLSGQMLVATKAIEEIEKKPQFKQRAIEALKSGGAEFFRESIKNPSTNILLAALEEWQSTS
ncbi:hypothetical protein [Synechococcus sp. PCC 7336]|uniref:hypothetical protein n=1 Tax=Synechococcus sp. PCC 7336 TaxID=195250 RepID=UPI000348018B|nr:hypothetical protein [Synechococcus sp. PCC 7336]